MNPGITLSVVLPTRNRLRQLELVVAGLERQTYPLADTEVIVVSDGSSDGTNAYLQSLQTPLDLVARLVPRNQGVAAARNLGVALARGEIVLFLDDDVVPCDRLAAEHVASHASGGDRLVVFGPMLTPRGFPLAPWVQWEQAMLLKQYRAMAAGRWQPGPRLWYTGNASLRRRDLLAAGGFDPSFRRAEDVELSYRLAAGNLRFVFNPAAVAYHHARRSYASWVALPYTYGINDVRLTLEKGHRWLLPSVFTEFHSRPSPHPGNDAALPGQAAAGRGVRPDAEGNRRPGGSPALVPCFSGCLQRHFQPPVLPGPCRRPGGAGHLFRRCCGKVRPRRRRRLTCRLGGSEIDPCLNGGGAGSYRRPEWRYARC